MKNDERIAKVYGLIAVILAFLAWIFAVVAGMAMYFTGVTIICAIFTHLASAILLATAVTGVGSLRKREYALACSIMSALCAVIIVCCAAMPFNNRVALGFALVSGFLSVAMYVLFGLYFVKSPRKIIYDSDELQYRADMLLNRINEIRNEHRDGHISDEEFNVMTDLLYKERDGYLEKLRTPQYRNLSKNQTVAVFLAPAVAMFVLFSVIIPCTVVKSYDRIYESIVQGMSEMSDTDYFCGGNHSDMRYVYSMPDSYKDVAEIKRQYTYARDQINKIYGGNGAESRQAHINLRELQKQDSRWNFDRIDFGNDLFDATWAADGYFITFCKSDIDGENTFTTNLPVNIPSELADLEREKFIEEKYYPNGQHKHIVELNVRIDRPDGGFSSANTVCVIREINLSDDGAYSIEVHCYATDADYIMTLS